MNGYVCIERLKSFSCIVPLVAALFVGLMVISCGGGDNSSSRAEQAIAGGPESSEMVVGRNTAKASDPGVATEVRFTVNENGFMGPDSTQSGWTRVILHNQGMESHHMALVRLTLGKTLVDLRDALEIDPDSQLPQWAVPLGGPADVSAGKTGTVIQNLDQGSYAVMSYVLDDNDIARPSASMLKSLQVTSGGPDGVEPTHDVVLEITDYSFRIRKTGGRYDNFGMSIDSGERIIKVSNVSEHVHEARIVEIEGNKQAQDFPDLYEMRKLVYGGSVSGASGRFSPFPVIKEDGSGPGGPPPGKSVGGVMALAPGQTVYVSINLMPAWHFIYDTLFDSEFQSSYLLRPMVLEFPVK